MTEKGRQPPRPALRASGVAGKAKPQPLHELRLLHQTSQALSADLALEAVLNAVADHFLAALDVESCTISGWDVGRDEVVTLLDRDPEPAAQVAPGGLFRLSDFPYYARLLQERRAFAFRRDDPSLDNATRRMLDTYRWRSLLAAPLVSKGRVMGLVELGERRRERDFGGDEIHLAESLASLAAAATIWESRTERQWTPDQVRLAQTLADRLATAIENARLFGEVQQLAVTDSLTGVHNRRYFFELAEREFERARRFKRPLSALMLDIDHFKRVNDTYGHAVGDRVLRALAQQCRQSLRDIDLLGRYGGEEFSVLLPECGLDGASTAAERVRRCVAEMQTETDRGQLAVTISLGVAAVAEDCPNLAFMLNRADIALYSAKKNGRNRVEVWQADMHLS